MKLENEINKIGNPYLSKEKTTGVWKVCFKYINNKGKQAKHYYSDGLNDIVFFALDKEGKKKVNADGAIIKNVREREALAKKRIERLKRDLDEKIFNINNDKAYFVVGDMDKSIITLMREFVIFKQNENTVNNKSILQYVSKVNGFEKWLELTNRDSIGLKEIVKEDITDFYTYLFAETPTKKGFSKKYRDDYNRFFVGFYNHIINYKEIDITNPMKSFNNINVGKTEMHKATDIKDFEALVSELKQSNFYLGQMYEFIFWTLHRIETIVSIKKEYINLDNNTIYLPASIMKNNEEVTITIAPHLLNILKDYLSKNEVSQQDYLFGKVDGVTQLFGSKQSRANTFSALFSNLKKATLKKGTPTLIHANTTLYSAKHSGIKFLMDYGYSDKQIISITGHKNVEQLGAYAKDYKPKKMDFPEMPKFK